MTAKTNESAEANSAHKLTYALVRTIGFDAWESHQSFVIQQVGLSVKW